jgi:hypothetical protein
LPLAQQASRYYAPAMNAGEKALISCGRRHVFLWLIVIAIPVAAQSNPSATQCSSPEAILQHYVTALGGEAAIQGIQTSEIETEETRPDTFKPTSLDHNRWKFKWKAPNKVQVKQMSPPFGIAVMPRLPSSTFMFDGQAWSDYRGRVLHNEDRVPPLRRSLRAKYPYNDYPQNMMNRVVADPLMIARSRDLYSSFTADSDFTASPGYCILHATGPDEFGYRRVDTLYFDEESWLLKIWRIQVGSRYQANFSEQSNFVKFQFDDYRQVDAVKIPFSIYFSYYQANFHFTKVRFNQSLSDAEFTPR